MYRVFPDAISATKGNPIHAAIRGTENRDNPRVAVEIVQFLLDCDPKQNYVEISSLLHLACQLWYDESTIEAGIQVMKILFNAQPASVRSVKHDGDTMLHLLCDHRRMNEAAAIQMLKFLLEKYPEAVRHAERHNGRLPIHTASRWRSPEFCHLLIDAYPGSERIIDSTGNLPLHCACAHNSMATVEYLYKLYPDGINHASSEGSYPIHTAIKRTKDRDCPNTLPDRIAHANPEAALEILQFLLDCDPNQKLIQFRGLPLLRAACEMNCGSKRDLEHSVIDAVIHTIKIIYGVHPEAAADNRIAADIYVADKKTKEKSADETDQAALEDGSQVKKGADGNLPTESSAKDDETMVEASSTLLASIDIAAFIAEKGASAPTYYNRALAEILGSASIDVVAEDTTLLSRLKSHAAKAEYSTMNQL